MSRKYRHSGYQDNDRDREKGNGHRPATDFHSLTPEERIQRRSLRRATTREAHEVMRCHVCGRDVPDFGAIANGSGCPHCAAPLHCCRACLHFDTAARWQCRAQVSEPVEAKTKPNHCPSWTPRLVLDSTGRRATPATSVAPRGRVANDPKTQFENLFKN
jgi:hypothetical protein